MKTGYLTFEVRRTLRDSRFLIFAVVLPVGLFLLEAGRFGADVSAAYIMGSLAAFGSFRAALDTGARTAVERGGGWQRQLRLTPLTGGGYLAAKASVGMLVALLPVAAVSLAAAFVSGVHLSAGGWLVAVLGIWVANLPFALLGLLLGQLATPQTITTYQGGVLLLFSFIGGLLIPVSTFPPALAAIAKVLPTYWLAEVGHDAALGDASLGQAIAVLAVYTVAFGAAVVIRYRRDSARV